MSMNSGPPQPGREPAGDHPGWFTVKPVIEPVRFIVRRRRASVAAHLLRQHPELADLSALADELSTNDAPA